MAPSAPPAASAQRQSETPQGFNTFNSRQGTAGPAASTPPQQSPMGAAGPGFNQGGPPPPAQQQQQQPYPQHERSFSQSQGRPQSRDNGSAGRMGNGNSMPHSAAAPSYSSSGPPQLQTLPFQTAAPQTHPLQQNTPTHQAPPQQQHQQYGQQQQRTVAAMDPSNLPPLKPVFGMNLEQLFQRDGSPIPMVVYQCIQAVDLFGLEVEGIYRVSGTAAHVNKIKAIFNNGTDSLPPIPSPFPPLTTYPKPTINKRLTPTPQTPPKSTSATPKPSSTTSTPSPACSSNSSATSPTPSSRTRNTRPSSPPPASTTTSCAATAYTPSSTPSQTPTTRPSAL